MKLSPIHLVVVLLWCAMASAQNEQASQDNDYVALTLAPIEKSKKGFNEQQFNPNGIKLQSNLDASIVRLEFIETLPDVTIEVIDVKGRLIKDFRGHNVSLIRFDAAQLTAGNYFIRVKSNRVKDFLKFSKQ